MVRGPMNQPSSELRRNSELGLRSDTAKPENYGSDSIKRAQVRRVSRGRKRSTKRCALDGSMDNGKASTKWIMRSVSHRESRAASGASRMSSAPTNFAHNGASSRQRLRPSKPGRKTDLDPP